MCDIMKHRGPDDAGYIFISKKQKKYIELTDNSFLYKNPSLETIESESMRNKIKNNDWILSMGHRRLSIIDLSANAHQPMANSDKTIWIVYNGEIYNFMDLKKELKGYGHRFNSNSDTEVIIKSYEQWGIECLKKFNGMFAFALWDSKKDKFFLARDRYGIIPVYYHYNENIFVFGSEIKSILASGITNVKIDHLALNEYFTFQNIFSDRTLFENIKILPAGCYMEIDNAKSRITKYWDYDFSSDNFNLTEKETAERLCLTFTNAVKHHLVSDVPVGSFLSGGMDTGSIVSVAKEHFSRLWTFTVGFDLSSASGLELGFDERKYSEILANLLKTEHYEAVLHAGDMEAVLPELIWHIEDLRVGQCYPDYYASRLAGKFVKVVLSGTGGDELFGGYPWRYYRAINPSNKNDYLQKYYNYWQRLVSDTDKKGFFNKTTYSKVKEHSTFDVFCSVFPKDSQPKTAEDFINQSLYFEIKTFLHGLFVITNKISMAHSLETRVPFLDNELVDFAMKIPPRLKLKNLHKMLRIDENEPGKLKKYYQKTNDGKIILRKAMQKLIPKNILEREKQGFSAPDASWFRGESIEYVKSMLLNKKARVYEYLNFDFVNKKIEEHVAGKINHRLFIWSCLSFEWWLRKFLYEERQTLS